MAIKNNKKQQGGFALLMTLIVVGVVLSVGMVILDLSIKQVKLSTNARESEVAFHAANAGAECARYWRKTEATNMLAGLDMDDVSCFGESPIDVSSVAITDVVGVDTYVTGDGVGYSYKYQFTWGSNTRCTQVDTLLLIADPAGAGVTASNVSQTIPGYPDGSSDPNESECETGAQCTVMSVRGYNKVCPGLGGSFGYGVVQREVLLQF